MTLKLNKVFLKAAKKAVKEPTKEEGNEDQKVKEDEENTKPGKLILTRVAEPPDFWRLRNYDINTTQNCTSGGTSLVRKCNLDRQPKSTKPCAFTYFNPYKSRTIVIHLKEYASDH